MLIRKDKYGKTVFRPFLISAEKIDSLKRIKEKNNHIGYRYLLQPHLEKLIKKFSKVKKAYGVPREFAERKVITIGLGENINKQITQLTKKLHTYQYFFIEEAISMAEREYSEN